MIRILHPTVENLKSNAETATLTSMTSGLVVFGFELPLFLQMIGVGIAFISMIIGGLYYYALLVEKKRSNRADEDEQRRHNDELIKIAKGK